MSGSFSRSFLKVERSLVFRPARVPNTFPRVSGIDGSQRFCKNCQTSVLFRLGAIHFDLRLHGRHSAYSLPEVNVQVHATVPGSALLIQLVALAALAMISPAFRPKLAGWLTCVYESTP